MQAYHLTKPQLDLQRNGREIVNDMHALAPQKVIFVDLIHTVPLNFCLNKSEWISAVFTDLYCSLIYPLNACNILLMNKISHKVI